MLRVTFQAVFLVAVVGLLLFLFDNVVYNLERLGIPTGFDYLRQPAGFAIPDTDFRSSQSLLDALLVGVQNTIKVALLGIVLATIVGRDRRRLAPLLELARAAGSRRSTSRPSGTSRCS